MLSQFLIQRGESRDKNSEIEESEKRGICDGRKLADPWKPEAMDLY